MYVLYEEGGELKTGSVLSASDATLQVENSQGKRSKIKSASVLIRFATPVPTVFMQQAQALSQEIDVELLWTTCTPDTEVGFESLAQTYMGAQAGPVDQAAILFCLHEAPLYFYRKGKGHFRPASEANLKAALIGLERKRQQEIQKEEALVALRQGIFPDWMRATLPGLIYAPDKNSLAFKTLDAAAATLHCSTAQVLEFCGVLRGPRDWHEGRFQYEYFGPWPEQTHFPLLDQSALLPLAADPVFSIDDASTTEIDDAFSVSEVDSEHWLVGIHIAAPALGISPGSPLDEGLQTRLSTVYMPGHKIPMLPDHVIETFTLQQGTVVPALSLLMTVRKSDHVIVQRNTCLQRVQVQQNLRSHEVESWFEPLSEAHLVSQPYAQALQVLWQLAQKMALQRGVGERPAPQYQDFTFHIESDRVQITPRPRGSPLDTLVAEMMIEANTYWGYCLAQAQWPALFRTQSNGKTSMSVRPGAHQGLGVSQYAWSTSPLRRYVDLINQWQLIRLIRQAPPVFDQEAPLLDIARHFELAYDAYNEFQRQMERYWCLRWIEQEALQETTATLMREGVGRLDGLPLVLKVMGATALPSGSQVSVSLGHPNLWDLSVPCHLK